MLLGKNSLLGSHYDILSVKEDASYEEIRASYRSAILNSHPDKLQKACAIAVPENESQDRFLKVQNAWEILSDPKSRAIYDSELRASRQDTIAAEDISLEDMMVEDTGELVELFYQCRCGDYFSTDSLDLEKIGCTILRNGSKISIKKPDSLPATIILPCGSCSLQIHLVINADFEVSTDGHS